MTKIKKVINENYEGEFQLFFMCPACNDTHAVNHTWDFNGDLESPTLSPSILTHGVMPDGNGGYKEFRCHSWITKGKIKFFGDCSHDKAGQKWFDLLDIN